MNPLQDLLLALSLQRAPYWSAEQLERAQAKRLRAMVHHAYTTVPFYRARFDELGLRPEAIQSREDLSRLPITTRADVQRAGKAMRSDDFALSSLATHRSTGSTGRPITIYSDARFRRVREALFLRALFAAGYRPGHNLLLITHESRLRSRPLLRWDYASILDPPERILDLYTRLRPRIVYGCTTPLRQLAELIEERGLPPGPTRAVITVAETLDAETRRRIESAFGAQVFDFYGMTETGMIGFECQARAGYHLSEDANLVELLPTPAGEAHSLVVTNLMLRGTPLLRFETGDLAVPGDRGPCTCGRALPRIERLAGRSADCLRTPEGSIVSPYQVTCALEQIPGLERFRVVQQSLLEIEVQVESVELGTVKDAICRRLADVLGETVRVRVSPKSDLEPVPGTKFRVVESRVAQTPASA